VLNNVIISQTYRDKLPNGVWLLFLVGGISVAIGMVLPMEGFFIGSISALFVFSIYAFASSFFVGRLLDKTLGLIMALAFIIRILFALFTSDISQRTGGDEVLYDALGTTIKQAWIMGDFSAQHGLSSVYPEINALLYMLFNDSFLAVRFLNCLVGMLTVWSIYLVTTKIVSNIRVARLSAFLVAIEPNLIDIAVRQRKDAIIILVTILMVYWFLRIGNDPARFSNWLILGMLMMLLLNFRAASLVLIMSMGMGYLSLLWARRHVVAGSIIAVCSACLLLVIWQLNLAVGGQTIDQYINTYFVGDERFVAKAANSEATAAQLAGNSGGEWSARAHAILFVRSLLTPLPFYVLNGISLPEIVDSLSGLLWFGVIIPFVPIGLLASYANIRIVLPVGLVLATLVLLAHPIVAFAWEPYRYRLPIIPLILMIAAIGAVAWQDASGKQKWLFDTVILGSAGIAIVTGLFYIRQLW
jgi:hypothetical protein